MPGTTEWIIILVIGLLIFGRRLPEVGRSLGKGIVEFKKGIKGIEDEIETESTHAKPAELDQKASFSEQSDQHETPVGGKSPFKTDSGASSDD
ncbi:MAG: twin-arginine translocase TatA/TatE family subunit [Planctomycetaceae bacterium]|nr:twin-arginine translocase TatA/TatE family subunit [Planctomycetaceae bacterium]